MNIDKSNTNFDRQKHIEENKVGRFIYNAGIATTIFGVIIGLFWGLSKGWNIGTSCIISSIVIGIFFIGMSEIIELLSQISIKLK